MSCSYRDAAQKYRQAAASSQNPQNRACYNQNADYYDCTAAQFGPNPPRSCQRPACQFVSESAAGTTNSDSNSAVSSASGPTYSAPSNGAPTVNFGGGAANEGAYYHGKENMSPGSDPAGNLFKTADVSNLARIPANNKDISPEDIAAAFDQADKSVDTRYAGKPSDSPGVYTLEFPSNEVDSLYTPNAPDDNTGWAQQSAALRELYKDAPPQETITFNPDGSSSNEYTPQCAQSEIHFPNDGTGNCGPSTIVFHNNDNGQSGQSEQDPNLSTTTNSNSLAPPVPSATPAMAPNPVPTTTPAPITSANYVPRQNVENDQTTDDNGQSSGCTGWSCVTQTKDKLANSVHEKVDAWKRQYNDVKKQVSDVWSGCFLDGSCGGGEQ
jgi:hypothetical protein